MATEDSGRNSLKMGEQSLKFLFTYLEEEKRRRQQEADSTTGGLDGLSGSGGGQAGYRLHHQLRTSLRDFSYHDVPTAIRNRLKESRSHQLTARDVECEVFDWLFQHLEEK